MALAHNILLLVSVLLLVSIVAGMISSRFGAPLLLVFLGIGMIVGTDGLHIIDFNDYQTAFVIGNAALAVILFDGGLRTKKEVFRLALWPSLALATVGVVATAGITAACVHYLLDLAWLEAWLLGVIVASTDAAAVFLVFGTHGGSLNRRVSAILEAESGLNDPMAVLLTVILVEALLKGVLPGWAELAEQLAVQLLGGAAVGVVGGLALVRTINRINLSQGLYPILALAMALFTFAVAQSLQMSGFLAVYLCGLILGNQRHKAAQMIDKFQDGLAWLSQIVMFLMLGLLLTPSDLVPIIVPAVLTALALIFIARPLSVLLCLTPFRIQLNEQAFIAWVGLRGAVPIFLGTIPVMAGVPSAEVYFCIAFVVVFASLIVQGWTVTPMARLCKVRLPAQPVPPSRLDLDLPGLLAEGLTVYTVKPGSRAAGKTVRSLPLPEGAEVLSVIREGKPLRPGQIKRLEPEDCAVLMTPDDALEDIDRLFATAADSHGGMELGDFVFNASQPLEKLAFFYDFPLPADSEALSVGEYLTRQLGERAVISDRVRLGHVDIVVTQIGHDHRIEAIAIALRETESLREKWQAWRQRLRRSLGG